jgi:hypothetical protein
MLNVPGKRRWGTPLVAAGLILGLMHGCVSVTAEMSPGERLYRANCGSCHRLIGPEEHDVATWQHYVDEYGSNLDDDEKRQVLTFLTRTE